MRQHGLIHVRASKIAFVCGSVAGLGALIAACDHLVPSNVGYNRTTPGASYSPGPPDEIVDGTPPKVVKVSCGTVPFSDPWSPGYVEDPTDVENARAVVGAMTVTEQADQMRGTNPGGGGNFTDIFRTPDNPNKGIKGFLFRDGPRGTNLAAQLPAGKDGFSTSFPVPMARGATFDMDLEYRIGVAAGDETIASGNTMLLAPTVNILRHPAWGRAQETYGEDSYLLGRMGSAVVAGIQTYLPACAKHFLGNNIENGRASDNSQMDEQTLREIYGRHFEMIVRDGGVACVMAAYNLVNNKKASQSKHLLTDMLRTDMGFKGFVLSDWWAMPPGTAPATSDGLQANAIEAVNAGMDMELPWSYNYQQIEAVTGLDRPLPESHVIESAQRIVEQKYRFRVAKVGYPIGLTAPTTYLSDRGSIEGNEAHIAIAHEAAIKAMVLLKNDPTNGKPTLPIDRKTVKTIAVIGAEVPYHVVNTDSATGTIHFSTDVRLGDLGSSRVYPDPKKASGPAAGIQKAAGSGVTILTGSDASLADKADFVVAVVGLTPQDEGEEYTGAGDRDNFDLDGKAGNHAQNDLVAALAQRQKPMVVVVEAGSVINMPWLAQVPALVMAWYPGMDGGNALGELLFGDASFSGKLPITWPKSWNDEPPFHTGTSTDMDYYLGYRYFDKNNVAPLFPFGSGLSYASFQYRYLQVPCSDVPNDSVVKVQADITNTGTVKADEVSFLFVSFPNSKVRRSVKELRGFHRTSLDPGQTRRISFDLRINDLKYWDTDKNNWAIESGPVDIMVGPSSDNLPLKDTLIVK